MQCSRFREGKCDCKLIGCWVDCAEKLLGQEAEDMCCVAEDCGCDTSASGCCCARCQAIAQELPVAMKFVRLNEQIKRMAKKIANQRHELKQKGKRIQDAITSRNYHRGQASEAWRLVRELRDECDEPVRKLLNDATDDEHVIALAFVRKLMSEGRTEHGALDLATDERTVEDLLREAMDERLDAEFYKLAAAMKLARKPTWKGEQERRKAWREHRGAK